MGLPNRPGKTRCEIMCRLIHPTPVRSFGSAGKTGDDSSARGRASQRESSSSPRSGSPRHPPLGVQASGPHVERCEAPRLSTKSEPYPADLASRFRCGFTKEAGQQSRTQEPPPGATTAFRTAGKRWQRFSRPQRFVLRASPPPEPVSILVQRLRTNTFPSPRVRGGGPRCRARGGPWGRRRGVAGLETPPHREAWPDPAGAAAAAGPAAGGGAERRGGHPGSSPSTMLAAQNTLQHNAQRVQQQGRQNRARRASGR